ncbi:hypothetical protein Hpkin58_10190 [Helicobacter pylori]
MYQNENLFTISLILPQIYWISKKILGCFDALNQAFKSIFNLIGINWDLVLERLLQNKRPP